MVRKSEILDNCKFIDSLMGLCSVRNITDDLNQKRFKSISKSDFDFDLNHLEINDIKPRFMRSINQNLS